MTVTRIARFAGAIVLVLACISAQAQAPAKPAAPSRVQTLTPAVARDVRLTVQAQLDAFAADNAIKAFSFAAPDIRKMFGTPEQFMAMVRSQYPMVHRPASVTFQKPELMEGSVLQRVRITDVAGNAWMASYRLDQLPQGWRIGACVVAPAGQGMTT